MLIPKKNLLEKILNNISKLYNPIDFIKISIASPNKIKSWADRILPNGYLLGQIKNSELINIITGEPLSNGLFCEKIFGPKISWTCQCKKYSGIFINHICEICHVELIDTRVRRYRMGYIDLNYPIIHPWYLKALPSYICLFLQTYYEYLKINDIENFITFSNLKENNIFNILFNKINLFSNIKQNYIFNILEKYNIIKIKKKNLSGTEIIYKLLENINLTSELIKLRTFFNFKYCNIFSKFYNYKHRFIQRIRIIESFLITKTKPEWMLLTILPVLPPILRPLLELDNGKIISSSLNELYRLIITKNNYLFFLLSSNKISKSILIRAKIALQQSINILIDNTQIENNKIFLLNNKNLKSLTEILKGKQGRFRQSLLGKRLDYSGRSVIIVNPYLKLNQCGIPFEIAKELFEPFLINKLIKLDLLLKSNLLNIKYLITLNIGSIWTLLLKILKKYNILLNRAPTLHRLGIQSFNPILILDKAIHLHPLVCTSFNADFDGDQMAIYLPLYKTSQFEIQTMMRSFFNILSSSNSELIIKPTQDMIIGCYYLTLIVKKNNYIIKKWFGNELDVLNAYYQKKINLHTSILLHYKLHKFKFKIINKTLKFINKNDYINNTKEYIKIYKIFIIHNNIQKYYLITNLGILVAFLYVKNIYQLTDLFLETSPGRLLFSINYKNSLYIK